ncbi:unnamed protein product [Scytosiphon promiscuus]
MVLAPHIGGSTSLLERQERLSVLDKIVTCLESKKPSWQKARILHLSTQLEDSMFNAKGFMADYKDESTLPARISQHCRLLAASKVAIKPPAGSNAGAGQSVHSFVATPESRDVIVVNGHDYMKPSAPVGLGTFGRRASSNFVVGPPPDPTARRPQAVDGGGRGREGGHGAGSGMVPSIAASESTGVGRGSSGSVRVPLSALATAAAAGQASVIAGAGIQGLNLPLGSLPLGGSAVGDAQQKLQHQRFEGGGGVEETSENGVAFEHRGALQAAGHDSRAAAPSVAVAQQPNPPASSEQVTHGSDVPPGSHSSPGETTEDDMNDDDEDTDGDRGAAANALAVLGTGEVSAIKHGHPGDANAAAPAGGPLTEEEEEDEEDAHLNAVIAAASRGASSGGGERSVHHEGGHQYMSLQQQHPKATDAEVKQHALRLLQSRLLLLMHASTCAEEEGSCPLAPLCGSVQQLLDHMQSCGQRKSCEFPHCSSSKAVLQHKRMCKDAACGLCSSVKDLSQKCFWANARHLHKRRLEESHEQRRKKRQSEGKAVAPPRKLQADKAKGGRESCFGLDEHGNHLGDISLGFFLRQDKAVKARKALMSRPHGQTADADNDDIDHIVADTMASPISQQQQQPHTCEATASTAGNPITAADVQRDVVTATDVGEKRTHDGNTKERAAPLEGSTPSDLTAPIPDQVERPPTTQPSVSWSSVLSSSSPEGDSSSFSTAQHDGAPAMVIDNRQGEEDAAEAGGIDEGPDEMEGEGMPGGGSEARGLRATSGDYACDDYGGGDGRAQHDDGMKAVAGVGHYGGAGGMTVAIPSLGSGAADGHFRSPSEIMLDEIAESLADTSRKPSFARMQSVQAFLDDHVELRQNASFGDVSAMVEQWMSLEDNTCTGNSNNNGSSSNVADEEDAFSF